MNDYTVLTEICRKNSEMAGTVVDKFLLYYAAKQERLEPEMDSRFSPFRHILKKFPEGWVNMLKSQYIAHRIFRKGGLIHKYLRHSALKDLSEGERSYLERHSLTTWRFSYSRIVSKPAADFYLMQEAFREDTFLLYSPGISKTLEEYPVILWFNLIGFNGSCWQTYGPIGAYRGFEPDDIFFFATEYHPQIESDEDLMADVENNPVPYMLLLSGGNYPLIRHGKDQIVLNVSTYECDRFDIDSLAEDFTIEHSGEVCRLGLKRWNGPPHFSTAYYDSDKGLMLLSSMTDRGFQQLAERLNTQGYHISADVDIRVNQSMITTTEDMLKRKIMLDSYGKLFEEMPSAEIQEKLDRLNDLLQKMLPDINAGRVPDIESLAAQSGCDVETARELTGQVISRINKLKGS